MTLVAYHSLFFSTVFQTISYKPCHLAIRVRVASFNPIYCRMANDVSIPPNRSAPSLTSWPLKATINRLSALRGGLVLIALTPPPPHCFATARIWGCYSVLISHARSFPYRCFLLSDWLFLSPRASVTPILFFDPNAYRFLISPRFHRFPSLRRVPFLAPHLL